MPLLSSYNKDVEKDGVLMFHEGTTLWSQLHGILHNGSEHSNDQFRTAQDDLIFSHNFQHSTFIFPDKE